MSGRHKSALLRTSWASGGRIGGRRGPGASRRAGFTILEVVFALAILLLGMTVVLSLLTFGAALSRTASLRTTAAAAIEAVALDLEETLFPLDPSTGEVGEPPAELSRVLPSSSRITYTATTLQNPERPLEYRVDVELTWTAAGVQRTERFRTILLQELPFGERLRRMFVEGERGALPSATVFGGDPAPEGTPAETDRPSVPETAPHTASPPGTDR